MAGLAALGMALLIGKLWAQGPASPAPAAGAKSRVGLVNLTYVIKNYEKFKAFQEELKKTVEPFQATDNKLKGEMDNLTKEAQKPGTTAEKREQMERRHKELARQLEDNKNEAQKKLVKKQEEQLRILYMDVRSVVHRYAQAHGFDMVLHYNDAVTQQDYDSAQNIARKMQAGALVPLYTSNGLDISYNVMTTLNQQYKASSPAPTAPAATGARPGTPNR
jgi:Skp family chaperone for outer membrane proteins